MQIRDDARFRRRAWRIPMRSQPVAYERLRAMLLESQLRMAVDVVPDLLQARRQPLDLGSDRLHVVPSAHACTVSKGSRVVAQVSFRASAYRKCTWRGSRGRTDDRLWQTPSRMTGSRVRGLGPIRSKAFVLYEGTKTPHRSCGIALAEAFGRRPTSYQSLRRADAVPASEISGQCDLLKNPNTNQQFQPKI